MLVAIVLLIFALVVAFFGRGVFSPISITLGVLAVSTALASLQLYGLHDFDPVAFRVILIGGTSVFAGALVTMIFRGGRRVSESSGDRNGSIRYGRLSIALAGSALVILVSRRAQFEILMAGGSLADVRNSYLGYGDHGAVIDLADRILVGPVLTVALPVFVWSLLRRKANPWFMVLFSVVVALNQATSGGRFLFLYAGVMVVALLARSGSLHLRTARARMTLAALVCAVAVLTLARGNAVLFEAYTYFSIPVPLLSHWVAIVESLDVQTYGASFVYGVLTLVFRLSEIIGFPIGADISAAVALPQENWVELLPGRHFNAFVTLFYYFFLDFSWLGVIFGGFVWGIVGQWSFGRMWSGSPRALFFGLLMLQVAVMAFVRWEFTNGSLVIALFLLPLFVKSDVRGATVSEFRARPELPDSSPAR